MSCKAVKCGFTLDATGFECTPVMEVAYKLAAQETYDSTGALNGIPYTDTLNQAYFQAMIDNPDPTKRLYILPPMKNIDDNRGDNKNFEFDDQSVEFLLEGARKFMAMLAGGNSGGNSPQMKALIEQFKGKEMSFYIISVANQFIHNISSDGLSAVGIPVDTQSISALLKKKSNSTPQHLALSFNWSQIATDDSLRMFDCNEIGGANLLGLKSPLGMCYDLIDVTTTTLKIKIRNQFGTPQNPITADGLLVADFVSSDSGATSKIYNYTDDADVTITSVVESPDGTYLLTFAAQTLGDVLVPYAVKSGYDFACMKNNPVDIDS